MSDEALTTAIRRVMVRLLPLLLLMYVIAFLDRVNIGFAKEEFQAHAGISDAAYALGAGLFFVGYALFEVPSNVIMQRVGARWWMCRIMVTWGVISAAMALVTDETLFYVLRFLLGLAEAGFFPGVILFITYWVPHAYRARCNAMFYFGIPLASVLGGPLSGALLAVRKRFDAVGIAVLAEVTALGGGVFRDLVIGAVPPVAFTDMQYFLTPFAAAALAFFWHPRLARIR